MPSPPPSIVITSCEDSEPAPAITSISITHDSTRAYVFDSYRENEHPQGSTYWANHLYWNRVYVNPYSGTVTGRVNVLTDWIDLSRRLHQNLLLRYDVGHYVVGFSTLFILVLVATGLVLWWPRNKAALRQRFTIKWTARWRRLNYDLHYAGGFYVHLLILLLAITGLVWTFDWWTNGIYRLLGNDPKIVFPEHEMPVVRRKFSDKAIDKAFANRVTQRSGWTGIELELLTADSSGRAEIGGYVNFNSGSGWDESDEYYYHPTTGALFYQTRQEAKPLGAKWRNSNYAIHVGIIYGWSTKVLATLAALMLASLPITGFLIWWGRRKKSKVVLNRQKIAGIYSGLK